MRLLISRHPDVARFAADRYKITESRRSLARSDFPRLPPNTQIFGNLPIPFVSDFLSTRPDCRYYHLIIPNVYSEGLSYTYLMQAAYFQRFHVEKLEEYDGHESAMEFPAGNPLP